MCEENKEQYNGIDLLKFIMAIFVIMIHTDPFENIKSELFRNIYTIIVAPSVPFFFITSGFLIFSKMKTHDDFKTIWKYMTKAIKLYLIFTLIYLPFTIYGYINNGDTFFVNTLAFIKILVFTGGYLYTKHLWYLLSLIYSLLLTGILLKYKVRLKIIYFISLLLFMFGSVMTILIKKIDVLDHSVQTVIKYYTYIFPNGSLFIGMFYVVTGVVILKYRCDISILLSIGFMMFFGNVFVRELYFPITVTVCAIIIFFLSVSIRIHNHVIYRILREASTIFYFMHMMFWTIYTILIKKPFHYGYDSFFVTILFCIFISIIFIKIKDWKKRNIDKKLKIIN